VALIPCEVAVKSVIPAIRALIAKELTESYGLKQKDVATLLGITQTAVSKYACHVRGRVLRIEHVKEIRATIKEIAVSLSNGRISRCELVAKFCTTCEIIRRKRLMCELCKRSDPMINIQECFVCLSQSPLCRKITR